MFSGYLQLIQVEATGYLQIIRAVNVNVNVNVNVFRSYELCLQVATGRLHLQYTQSLGYKNRLGGRFLLIK